VLDVRGIIIPMRKVVTLATVKEPFSPSRGGKRKKTKERGKHRAPEHTFRDQKTKRRKGGQTKKGKRGEKKAQGWTGLVSPKEICTEKYVESAKGRPKGNGSKDKRVR